MQDQLNNLLAPAVARQRLGAALRSAARALLLGSIVALLLLPGRLIGGELIAGWLIAAVPIVAALLGAIAGYVRGGDLSAAARAVDRHYRLHDRLISALEFSASGAKSAFQRRQVDDALAAAGRVDVRRAISLRPPRRAWIVGALAMVVMAMCFVPVDADDAGPSPNITAAHRASIETLRLHKERLGQGVAASTTSPFDDDRLSPARRHAVERYFRSAAASDADNAD